MNRMISFIFLVLLIFSYQTNIFAESKETLPLKSEAAVLLDSDTNAVLFTKNADKQMYPASLTKIATAIYAIEKGNLESVATVSANAVRQDGTRVYLVEGEQVPLKKLIQGMLINSGNDAAVAIAEHIDGSVEQFAQNINEYLKQTVHVHHTHFTNPSGLFDKNHYTTASDLALITNYAIKNPVFTEIFGTKQLPWKGQSWETTILTHHTMLKGEYPYPGITGGKTGYTTESKQTLATTANNGNIRLTAVVLKSDQKRDKYNDTAQLFDYGFKSFQHRIIKQGEVFKKDTKEFYPGNDILVTEDVQGTSKEVSKKGVLSIKNHLGNVLQVAQLKSNEPESNHATASAKKAKSNETDNQGLKMNLLYGFFIIAVLAVIFGTSVKLKKGNEA